MLVYLKRPATLQYGVKLRAKNYIYNVFTTCLTYIGLRNMQATPRLTGGWLISNCVPVCVRYNYCRPMVPVGRGLEGVGGWRSGLRPIH